MADPISDIHIFLTTCGASVEATHTLIINNESLISIEDLGFLDGGNDDLAAMLSRMARCVANIGRVILGGIQIKKIQLLVWWVRDCQKLVQLINAALWMAAVMKNSGIAKRIEKDQPKEDMTAAYLQVSNPDEFETHEDAIRNLLS